MMSVVHIHLPDIDLDKIFNWLEKHGMAGRLNNIEAMLTHLTERQVKEMAAIDDLKTQVERTVGLEESAIALINNLAAQLATSTDPAMQALGQQLSDEADALGKAISANSPAPTP